MVFRSAYASCLPGRRPWAPQDWTRPPFPAFAGASARQLVIALETLRVRRKSRGGARIQDMDRRRTQESWHFECEALSLSHDGRRPRRVRANAWVGRRRGAPVGAPDAPALPGDASVSTEEIDAPVASALLTDRARRSQPATESQNYGPARLVATQMNRELRRAEHHLTSEEGVDAVLAVAAVGIGPSVEAVVCRAGE